MSTQTTKASRIFLVDDHAVVREGLVTVLAQAGFLVCGQAGNIRETLDHPELASAHLAVVDLSIGEDSGLELIPMLRARHLPSLVYSMHEDSHIVRSAFGAGAIGYVTKREVASCLVEAVNTVLGGNKYISPRAGIGFVRPGAGPASADPFMEFSDQQMRLYELLGEGLGTDEIAERLHVSPRTVESYGARMIEKLNVSGMKDLRRRAISDRLHRHLNPP